MRVGRVISVAGAFLSSFECRSNTLLTVRALAGHCHSLSTTFSAEVFEPQPQPVLPSSFASASAAQHASSRVFDGPPQQPEEPVEELVQHTNVYRGLAASLGTVLKVGTPGCIATSEEGMRLLHRAQKAGVDRSDIGFDDVVCIATAVSLATEKDASSKARISHLVDVFLSGIGIC